MHQKFPNSNNTSHQSRSLNVVIDTKICMEKVNELNATDVISMTNWNNLLQVTVHVATKKTISHV